MSPADAEDKFIEAASHLETYGVDPRAVKVSRPFCFLDFPIVRWETFCRFFCAGSFVTCGDRFLFFFPGPEWNLHVPWRHSPGSCDFSGKQENSFVPLVSWKWMHFTFTSIGIIQLFITYLLFPLFWWLCLLFVYCLPLKFLFLYCTPFATIPFGPKGFPTLDLFLWPFWP